MELRKRKNEERQEEEEVIEEPKGFMMQEMASAIFLSEEAILFFEEQDLNAERYTKIAQHFRMRQYSATMSSMIRKNNNNKELLSRHFWIAFPEG